MLLDLGAMVEKYAMQVTGVVHAGAHLAEEAAEYERLFPGRPVWWFEANGDVIPKIQRTIAPYSHQRVIEACLWSEDGAVVPFNVTNYDGMSSSVLEFGTHPQFSPDTVFVDRRELPTRTIDSLAAEHSIERCNFLNMDLQGVELHVAQGARNLIAEEIDYINSEVNTAEVYKGCAKVDELDRYFGIWGFGRVETSIVPRQGWGDALWVRR